MQCVPDCMHGMAWPDNQGLSEGVRRELCWYRVVRWRPLTGSMLVADSAVTYNTRAPPAQIGSD